MSKKTKYKNYDHDVNWNIIKNEYISTEISYKKLAIKYGIHYSTLNSKANKHNENWALQREQYRSKFDLKYQNEVITKESKIIMQMKQKERLNAELMESAVRKKILVEQEVIKVDENGNKVRTGVYQTVIDPKLSPRDLKDLMLTLKIIQEVKYRSHGIPDVYVGLTGNLDHTGKQKLLDYISGEDVDHALKQYNDGKVKH